MVIVAQLCEYTKSHWIVHFKWVDCVVCALFFNKAVVVFKNKGRKRGREGRRKEGQGPFAPHHFLHPPTGLRIRSILCPKLQRSLLLHGNSWLWSISSPYRQERSVSMRVKPKWPGGSDGKESAYNARDPGLIPGSGRFPGGGNGYLLQYSCLENSMDREARGATVHVIAKR